MFIVSFFFSFLYFRNRLHFCYCRYLVTSQQIVTLNLCGFELSSQNSLLWRMFGAVTLGHSAGE